MSFAWPWALLLFVPWAIAAWRVVRPAKTRGAVFAGASEAFGRMRPTWRMIACRVLPYLFLIGAAALIVGAAGPRRDLGKHVRTADALAVMMAVDVSGSMAGLDLATENPTETRLDVTKARFRDFVEARPDDLIGLVTFGGYTEVRSPLTADHALLLHVLSGVKIPMGRDGEQMTAIGDGLAQALLRIKDAEPKTKIVILLSDGVNNFGIVSPAQAAQAAANWGIRVYTIGMGTSGLVPMLGGGVSRMELDEATLQSIAETTGARYANVRSTEELRAFLDEIAALETTRVERQALIRRESAAAPFLLGGGALCLLAAVGLTTLIRRPL